MRHDLLDFRDVGRRQAASFLLLFVTRGGWEKKRRNKEKKKKKRNTTRRCIKERGQPLSCERVVQWLPGFCSHSEKRRKKKTGLVLLFYFPFCFVFFDRKKKKRIIYRSYWEKKKRNRNILSRLPRVVMALHLRGRKRIERANSKTSFEKLFSLMIFPSSTRG